ncbi:MAG: hypothetical protein IPL39_16165 [Opitutaceae bacterium]|nr:hypothetical protein [Opitutaceae bacterium]
MSTNAIALAFFASQRLPNPVPEYKFHPTRGWRFDYAWPDAKIALEVEGGIWMASHGKKSRHFTGSGAKADMEKYNAAACLGWRVLRCTPQQLITLQTVNAIKEARCA